MIRVPTSRPPTHPGEMLLAEFLTPLGITQRDLAKGINVPYQRINEIVNGKRGITPGTAIRLARFFGNTPDYWMNLQMRCDLYLAQDEETSQLKDIRPIVPVEARPSLIAESPNKYEATTKNPEKKRPLDRIVEEVGKLPPREQDAIAEMFLLAVADEQRWTELFQATTDDQWKKLTGFVENEIAEGGLVPVKDVFSPSGKT